MSDQFGDSGTHPKWLYRGTTFYQMCSFVVYFTRAIIASYLVGFSTHSYVWMAAVWVQYCLGELVLFCILATASLAVRVSTFLARQGLTLLKASFNCPSNELLL